MASGPITPWEIEEETVETVSDFIFGGSKITAEGECSHEIKRRLLLGRKVMINLDNIFKSRDITLPTKLRLAKAGWHHWLNGCVFKWTRELVMDMEAWRAAIHRVAKSWTWLSNWTELNWWIQTVAFSLFWHFVVGHIGGIALWGIRSVSIWSG